MLNRKLVEYTDISSKYVKVGVRYCVCLFLTLTWPLPLSSLRCCFYVSIPWFVTGPPTSLQEWGRPWRAWYYHPNLPFSFPRCHINPLQTHISSCLHSFTTHTHTHPLHQNMPICFCLHHCDFWTLGIFMFVLETFCFFLLTLKSDIFLILWLFLSKTH